MCSIESLNEDISSLLGYDLSYKRTTEVLENHIQADESLLSTSPLDKPLPDLPDPTSVEVPIMRIPTPVLPSSHNFDAPKSATVSDLWRQRFLHTSAAEDWVDTMFAGQDIPFGTKSSGYAWTIGKRIHEKVNFGTNMTYASALYECTQTKGRVRGPKAYMKIYMQVPYYCGSCDHVCTKSAEAPDAVKTEIAALKRMCQTDGDASAPRLLATKSKTQSKHMWVPGGFLTFVVIQQLPVVHLNADIFWSFPSHVRDEVRTSFKAALKNLWRAGVVPQNCDIENLAWNQVARRCYVVDLEGAELTDQPMRWFDYEYYRWGLSRTESEPCESAFDLDSPRPGNMINTKIKSAIGKAKSRDMLGRYQLPGTRLISTGAGG